MCAHSRRVVLSRPAREDLRDILAATAAHHGEQQSNAYGFAIVSALEQLATFPGIGRVIVEFSSDTRRFPVRDHVIYFAADDIELRVARILHHRMDATRALDDDSN